MDRGYSRASGRGGRASATRRGHERGTHHKPYSARCAGSRNECPRGRRSYHSTKWPGASCSRCPAATDSRHHTTAAAPPGAAKEKLASFSPSPLSARFASPSAKPESCCGRIGQCARLAPVDKKDGAGSSSGPVGPQLTPVNQRVEVVLPGQEHRGRRYLGFLVDVNAATNEAYIQFSGSACPPWSSSSGSAPVHPCPRGTPLPDLGASASPTLDAVPFTSQQTPSFNSSVRDTDQSEKQLGAFFSAIRAALTPAVQAPQKHAFLPFWISASYVTLAGSRFRAKAEEVTKEKKRAASFPQEGGDRDGEELRDQPRSLPATDGASSGEVDSSAKTEKRWKPGDLTEVFRPSTPSTPAHFATARILSCLPAGASASRLSPSHSQRDSQPGETTAPPEDCPHLGRDPVSVPPSPRHFRVRLLSQPPVEVTVLSTCLRDVRHDKSPAEAKLPGAASSSPDPAAVDTEISARVHNTLAEDGVRCPSNPLADVPLSALLPSLCRESVPVPVETVRWLVAMCASERSDWKQALKGSASDTGTSPCHSAEGPLNEDGVKEAIAMVVQALRGRDPAADGACGGEEAGETTEAPEQKRDESSCTQGLVAVTVLMETTGGTMNDDDNDQAESRSLGAALQTAEVDTQDDSSDRRDSCTGGFLDVDQHTPPRVPSSSSLSEDARSPPCQPRSCSATPPLFFHSPEPYPDVRRPSPAQPLQPRSSAFADGALSEAAVLSAAGETPSLPETSELTPDGAACDAASPESPGTGEMPGSGSSGESGGSALSREGASSRESLPSVGSSSRRSTASDTEPARTRCCGCGERDPAADREDGVDELDNDSEARPFKRQSQGKDERENRTELQEAAADEAEARSQSEGGPGGSVASADAAEETPEEEEGHTGFPSQARKHSASSLSAAALSGDEAKDPISANAMQTSHPSCLENKEKRAGEATTSFFLPLTSSPGKQAERAEGDLHQGQHRDDEELGGQVVLLGFDKSTLERLKALLKCAMKRDEQGPLFHERRERRLKFLEERTASCVASCIEYKAKETVGLIIGRQGERLEKLAKRFQVEIRVFPQEEDGATRRVRIYGSSRQAVEDALAEIQFLSAKYFLYPASYVNRGSPGSGECSEAEGRGGALDASGLGGTVIPCPSDRAEKGTHSSKVGDDGHFRETAHSYSPTFFAPVGTQRSKCSSSRSRQARSHEAEAERERDEAAEVSLIERQVATLKKEMGSKSPFLRQVTATAGLLEAWFDEASSAVVLFGLRKHISAAVGLLDAHVTRLLHQRPSGRTSSSSLGCSLPHDTPSSASAPSSGTSSRKSVPTSACGRRAACSAAFSPAPFGAPSQAPRAGFPLPSSCARGTRASSVRSAASSASSPRHQLAAQARCAHYTGEVGDCRSSVTASPPPKPCFFHSSSDFLYPSLPPFATRDAFSVCSSSPFFQPSPESGTTRTTRAVSPLTSASSYIPSTSPNSSCLSAAAVAASASSNATGRSCFAHNHPSVEFSASQDWAACSSFSDEYEKGQQELSRSMGPLPLCSENMNQATRQLLQHFCKALATPQHTPPPRSMASSPIPTSSSLFSVQPSPVCGSLQDMCPSRRAAHEDLHRCAFPGANCANKCRKSDREDPLSRGGTKTASFADPCRPCLASRDSVLVRNSCGSDNSGDFNGLLSQTVGSEQTQCRKQDGEKPREPCVPCKAASNSLSSGQKREDSYFLEPKLLLPGSGETSDRTSEELLHAQRNEDAFRGNQTAVQGAGGGVSRPDELRSSKEAEILLSHLWNLKAILSKESRDRTNSSRPPQTTSQLGSPSEPLTEDCIARLRTYLANALAATPPGLAGDAAGGRHMSPASGPSAPVGDSHHQEEGLRFGGRPPPCHCSTNEERRLSSVAGPFAGYMQGGYPLNTGIPSISRTFAAAQRQADHGGCVADRRSLPTPAAPEVLLGQALQPTEPLWFGVPSQVDKDAAASEQRDDAPSEDAGSPGECCKLLPGAGAPQMESEPGDVAGSDSPRGADKTENSEDSSQASQLLGECAAERKANEQSGQKRGPAAQREAISLPACFPVASQSVQGKKSRACSSKCGMRDGTREANVEEQVGEDVRQKEGEDSPSSTTQAPRSGLPSVRDPISRASSSSSSSNTTPFACSCSSFSTCGSSCPDLLKLEKAISLSKAKGSAGSRRLQQGRGGLQKRKRDAGVTEGKGSDGCTPCHSSTT
ncbi:hypothetical protein BESB_035970 [Besnoitia besnoiti]|uniref:K Homology domain-containing protein n=1 Tax=Besnoitia besnoiti TaxID=94643 RepID=A0A2A9MGV2_BESBE|nr:hypothetical protein BESB_035970 [Besnoitia besnoiti]PFH37139.1 hypothetical protein BESB_035970 [Besnoitia besnoiti]